MIFQDYSYAINHEGRLTNINDACKGSKYYCPNCGASMIPRQGERRRWHFAHKRDVEHCCYESYLHVVAKRKFYECFNNSSKFIIKFRSTLVCSIEECPLGRKTPCSWLSDEYKEFNLLDFYNCCEIEKSIGEYRADLLISNSELNRDPILIEFFVTHRCTEEKINSGYRIIEIHIESDKDIDRIVNSLLVQESDEICFYNFIRTSSPFFPNTEQQPHKFIFWIDPKGLYHFDDEEISRKCCDHIPKEIENSIFRIESAKYIQRDFAFYKLAESGIRIKFCDMCKQYVGKYEYSCNEYFQTRQFPDLIHATNCPHFVQKDYLHNECLSEIDYNQECKITIKQPDYRFKVLL